MLENKQIILALGLAFINGVLALNVGGSLYNFKIEKGGSQE